MKILTLMRASSGVDEFPLYRSLLNSDPDLVNFDDRIYGFYEAPAFIDRALRRARRAALVRRFNSDIQRTLSALKPDLMIIFKAPHLTADTITKAKEFGTKVILIYPDLDPTVHGKEYIEAIKFADYFYHTKPNIHQIFQKNIRNDAKVILPFYSMLECGTTEEADMSLGVSFIGHYSPRKFEDLKSFRERIECNMTIIGSGWGNFNAQAPAGFATRMQAPIYGSSVREIYRRSICSLGLLMEEIGQSSQGDEITSRSVLIPTSGGIIIHPRNKTSELLYGANCPGLFSDLDEALALIDELISKPGLRTEISGIQKSSVLQNATCAEDFVSTVTK